MQKKKKILGNFYFFIKKSSFFRLFTASVRSRPPGPPAVPGVLYFVNIIYITFYYIQYTIFYFDLNSNFITRIREVQCPEIRGKQYRKLPFLCMPAGPGRLLVSTSGQNKIYKVLPQVSTNFNK